MKTILGALAIFAAWLFAECLESAVMIGMILLMALCTMFCWNGVIPDIFGLKTLTFTQALYLNILAAILTRPRNK